LFSRFFIDRPIFATVLSIIITLTGSIALFALPIAQYPQIAPPSIFVVCNYPGASAEVVAEAVAAPIEQQVNGVENMLYMVSQSANDGSYTLTVTFKTGVNLNFAQVLVQNRVNLALPQLPDVVKQTGVTTRKRNPDILCIVSLVSPDLSRDNLYLSNYGTIQVRDELLRVDGVGDVFIFGGMDYSMRVWVDPEKLAGMNLTAGDVADAVSRENHQVPSGQIGQQPIGPEQQFQYTLSTLGRLRTTKEFDDIILKTTPDGRTVRIKDVGYCELNAKTQDILARTDGLPCTSIAVFNLPDSNALDVADRVRDKMKELAGNFPPGLEYNIYYDTTPFIRESINEVFKTLRDATILVAIVVLVFLQNWRSTLIPLVAVPVAIIGTFAVMAAMGFSLNNLTLFGLVLAIGIVVDDAIVVVEAVEHHIENGMSPRAATIRAMEEVSGPVIAVAMVLSAVFVPCAFISGITGQFFRQFALTIAVSTLISAFNSLTLSPALAAILLKPKVAKRDALQWLLDILLGWFFWSFNFAFRRVTTGYTRGIHLLLRGSAFVILLYGGLLALTYVGFNGLPKELLPSSAKDVKFGSFSLSHGLPVGYIPPQDKGYLMIAVQTPDATSLERTTEVISRIDKICHEEEGVGHTLGVSGQSFVLSAFGPNFGNFFVPLKDFHERLDPSMHSDEIAKRLRARIEKEIPDAIVAIFGPAPVQGLGTAGGFKIIIEDRGDNGPKDLQKQVDHIIDEGRKDKRISGLFTVFRANAPQLYVDVNRDQCFSAGVQLNDVFTTLQVYLGSLYVNDFNLFGRTWQVNIQALAEYRRHVEDVRRLRVRNSRGSMVPIGTLATVKEINGPLIVGRYNMYPAAPINGTVIQGISSGESIEIMEDLCNRELPPSYSFEWTEITYIQLISGNTAMVLFLLAVILVFLVLAALYESWSLPLAVILVVPMCLLSAMIGVAIGNGDINIFTQVGFVVLVGLASKNAILIVEFAKLKREAGMSREDATLEACKLRLRPILMTSFAFILGVLPLLITTGAGAEMRRTLGTAVFSGMLGVTLFGIFLTPVFYYVMDWLSSMPALNTPMMRRISYGALTVATLGIPWALLGLVQLAKRSQRSKRS
jgi:multidrug efflux pump